MHVKLLGFSYEKVGTGRKVGRPNFATPPLARRSLLQLHRTASSAGLGWVRWACCSTPSSNRFVLNLRLSF